MTKQLILGTAQLGFDYGINNKGGIVPENESIKILDLAWQAGVSILDTAIGYGRAHQVIGRYHSQRSNSFKVITKFHLEKDDPKVLESAINSEIEELNVAKLHGLLFHSASDFLSQPQNFEKLKELKSEGKIDHVGVSLYSNEEFEQVLDKDDVDIIQFPFNVFDNYRYRGRVIQRANDLGVKLHVRSIYLQGIFFKDTNELTGNLGSLIEPIRAMKHSAIAAKVGLQQLLMSYVCSIGELEGVIVGVDSEGQLRENVDYFHHVMRDENAFRELENLNVDPYLLNPSNWKP